MGIAPNSSILVIVLPYHTNLNVIVVLPSCSWIYSCVFIYCINIKNKIQAMQEHKNTTITSKFVWYGKTIIKMLEFGAIPIEFDHEIFDL